MTFVLDEEWYTIPMANGGAKNMSRLQVVHYLQATREAVSYDESKRTKFILHNHANPKGKKIYKDDKEGLFAAGFNPKYPTRFTIHGWHGGANSVVNDPNGFLKAGNFNHIVVDWSAGAVTFNYIKARNRVPGVAKVVGKFAAFLVNQGAKWSDIYMIGHSLGGQMAGLVGQYLKEGKIEACICLDPAGPLFSKSDPDQRASPGDCKYVEVIHTNGGVFGFKSPIGDSDFYLNGGRRQPGCRVPIVYTCSHNRAPEIFQESLLKSTPFVGRQCKASAGGVVNHKKCRETGLSTTMIGPFVNTKAKGIYHLKTARKYPFAL